MIRSMYSLSPLMVFFVANAFDGNRLTPASINTQLTTSLANLKRPYVDLFYLHAPDHLTPIEESLSEVQKLYKAGLFKEFGLSNYKSWEVSCYPFYRILLCYPSSSCAQILFILQRSICGYFQCVFLFTNSPYYRSLYR